MCIVFMIMIWSTICHGVYVCLGNSIHARSQMSLFRVSWELDVHVFLAISIILINVATFVVITDVFVALYVVFSLVLSK